MGKSDARNLIGLKFGRWTVLDRAEPHITKGGHSFRQWHCKCDCGSEKDVTESSLLKGTSKSCGCLKADFWRERNERNHYDLTGEFGKGYACNTNAEFLFDLDDYDKIKDIRWVEWRNGNRYNGIRGYDSKTQEYVKMSWIILGKGADHINHNPLDNRKCNLRSASSSENAANRGHQNNNRSGVIGVGAVTTWTARIRKDNVLHSKRCKTFEEAVRTRLLWEKEMFGEFAPQKHLFREYGITLEEAE